MRESPRMLRRVMVDLQLGNSGLKILRLDFFSGVENYCKRHLPDRFEGRAGKSYVLIYKVLIDMEMEECLLTLNERNESH